MLKTDFTPSHPRLVDGVESLHRQLFEVHQKAAKLAHILLGKPEPHKERPSSFSIYIDFEEAQPENKIKGYFMTRNTILHFLPIEFDYALLFPVKNHGGGTFQEAPGIKYAEIHQAKSARQKLFIRFLPIRALHTEENKVLYNIKIVEKPITSSFVPGPEIDDIGLPYYDFPDIEKLSMGDIPSNLQNEQYTLVGTHFYAPMTYSKDFDCVLFAQIDNEYDENAIKILRWFPEKKGNEVDQLLGMAPNGGDVFFELGYLSRSENAQLHKFMVENNSRLLFGKRIGDKISIEGGVKLFSTNDIKYPRCLYNIKLV